MTSRLTQISKMVASRLEDNNQVDCKLFHLTVDHVCTSFIVLQGKMFYSYMLDWFDELGFTFTCVTMNGVKGSFKIQYSCEDSCEDSCEE